MPQNVSILLALLVLGCGARPLPVNGTAPAQAQPASTQGLAPTFHSAGLPTWAAGTGWTLNADEQALRTALKRSIDPPPAIDCLAREYAARFAHTGHDPSLPTVHTLNAHCGGWSPPTRTYAVTGPDLVAVQAHFLKLGLDDLDTTVGIGAVQIDGQTTVALIIPPSDLALSPIPRRPKGPVKVQGRLRHGDGQLELWMHAPPAAPRKLPLITEATGHFSGAVTVTGATQLELTVVQGRFRRTAALIALHTPTPPLTAEARVEPVGPLAPMRTQVVAQLNAIRAAAGLKPLRFEPRFQTQLDDWLLRIANGSALPEPDGLLDDRGWPFAQIRYAFGEGAQGQAAVSSIVRSPTGHDTLLAPDVDRVGVGLRAFTRGNGVDVVLVALDQFDAVPPKAARAALLTRVNAARAAAGHPPLIAEPRLDEIAQATAIDALAGAFPWANVGERLTTDLNTSGFVRGGFGLGAIGVADPHTFDPAPEAGLMNPGLRYVGFGVQGGLLPGDGTPRHLVLFLSAQEVSPATPQ
jgi:hypothetical protein